MILKAQEQKKSISLTSKLKTPGCQKSDKKST